MSTISAGVTVPTALNLSGDTTGALTFQVSGTVTAATISSTGNVGIGNTAPSYKLQVNNASASATADAITVQNSGVTTNGHATGIRFRFNTAEPAAVRAILTNDQTGTGTLSFFTSSDGTGANLTERMRITSGGNVGINTTAPGNSRLRVQNSSGTFGNTDPIQSWAYANFQVINLHADGSLNPVFNTDSDSNWNPPATMIWQFRGTERMRLTAGGELYIAGTTDQGAYNLQVNGTGVWGAGAYVNGSDARLKDNIQSLDSSLDVVKAMRPVTFQYKPEYSKDQNVQPGFIAQELQQAMAGKAYLDGVVQSGPEYLNVAYQNIIPILVKAIQELEAKIAALESK